MGLSPIGAGYGRTGALSLKSALELLGLQHAMTTYGKTAMSIEQLIAKLKSLKLFGMEDATASLDKQSSPAYTGCCLDWRRYSTNANLRFR